ncbi:unnamed protein product [Ranitomeya imitator]|uniref:Uncharacterized protein n=1 Tax=Ranitomeya imitator TaxID=111125 RepID=A0ABN9LUG8_9NEOB|nr:unnamed protein product [Ranitomeya imitator]
MTEFQMRFEIPVVALQLCSLSSEDAETNCLANGDFGAWLIVCHRTECNEHLIYDEDKPVISYHTLDNTTDDLLTMEYIRLASSCKSRQNRRQKRNLPSTSKYSPSVLGKSGVTSILSHHYLLFFHIFPVLHLVNFSSLDVYLHTEALLNTMSFVTSLIPQSENKEPEQQILEVDEDEEEEEKKGRVQERN